MKPIRKLSNKKVNLNKLELISASIYLIVGMTFNTYLGSGIAILTMGSLASIFTILLIIFFRQQTFGQNKPLLTVLSIYYKSAAYSAIMLTISNLPFATYMKGATLCSIVIYAVLAYIFGKKYDEMLNAYLYLCLVGFVSGVYL